MLLRKFKVSGHSMEPAIENGQEILVSSLPFIFKDPETGDIIAFKNGDKFVVKRIKKAGKNSFFVKGDNNEDSREYGWIEKERIMGKVIYIY